MDYTIIIATRLKFNKTQEEMKDLLGLSTRQYTRLERGESPFLKIHWLALQTVIRDLESETLEPKPKSKSTRRKLA